MVKFHFIKLLLLCLLCISCGSSNGKRAKIPEVDRISSYIDLEAGIKTSLAKLNFADEVLLNIKYTNKTDTPVLLNLNAYISIGIVIPEDIFIGGVDFPRLNMFSGKENLIVLAPYASYLQTLPLKLEDSWCASGKNEYYIFYFCPSPTKKEPAAGYLLGYLRGPDFEIDIFKFNVELW